MVTEEQITEQVAAVEQAEVKLDLAEAHHESAGDEQAVNELRVARAGAHAARDKLRQLRTRYAAERAAERARAAAEADFPERERKARTKRLMAARDEAADALARGGQVAAEILAKVGAYSAAVRAEAADQKARGLSADGGQELGGTSGGVVHLGGEVFRPADAGALLGAVMREAVAACDARHPLAQLRWGQLGGLAAKVAQDELLAEAGARR